MENQIFAVTRIEGEYAYIRKEGTEDEEMFIALALLPPCVDIGSFVVYDGVEFMMKE